MQLTDFEAMSFDCYGTLIDWEAGLSAVLAPWAREQGLDLTGEQLLTEYSAVEAAVEADRPADRVAAREQSSLLVRHLIEPGAQLLVELALEALAPPKSAHHLVSRAKRIAAAICSQLATSASRWRRPARVSR